MERRRLIFSGLGALAGTLGLAATARAGILGDATGLSRGPQPDGAGEAQAAVPMREDLEDGVELAQYYGPPPGHRGPPPHRRGPRCWWVTRNVRHRDRWGRVHYRQVRERVCR